MRGCRHRTLRLPAPWCSHAQARRSTSHPTPARASPGISWTRPGRTHCFGGLPQPGKNPWLVSGLGLTVQAMDNRSPILRFGNLSDGKRSSYWRLRAGVARPELFLEREGFGRQWHFSLHASGRWHMKEGGQERISWARPDEVVPGYTRAVGIVQPVAVAHRDDPAPEGVELVTVPPEAEPTTFSVFMERPGANMNSWPGKNAMGTVFVGRIPLAGDAGTCCIVARQEPLEPGEVTLPRPSDTEGVRDAPRGAAAVDAAGSLACRSRSQPRAPRSGRFGESSVRVLSCAGQVGALKAAIPTVAAVRPRAIGQPAEVQFGSAAGAGSRGAAPRCRAGSGWS